MLELTSATSKFPNGPLTNDQVALVFSLFNIGGLVGSLTYLWIIERIGRKTAILFLAAPHIVLSSKSQSKLIIDIIFSALHEKI